MSQRKLGSAVWLMGMAVAVLVATHPGGAQRPLAPIPPEGQRIAPFFDGFYQNPDGTVTLSFGYSNLNRDTVEIPLGPDNFIQPKELDGRQPTSFPPGRRSRPGARAERERGVFTITVPAGFEGDVVWTVQHAGQTHRVPGRSKTTAYRLDWPMAMGSVPPMLRFAEDGPPGRGPVGVEGPPMKTAVGTALPLTIWLHDDSVRPADPVPVKRRDPRPASAMNVTWYKHSGPGPVEFSLPRQELADVQATASTEARFTQPGDYVLRVKADSFGRIDSAGGDQCCWTNGYVKVTVTP